MPTSNRPGLVVMVAASGVATDVAMRYGSMGDEVGCVVTLGCADKQLLEEFCQDLDTVDIRLEWAGPTSVSSPLLRASRGAEALAAAAARRAAASLRPPTPALQRARDALAAAYGRRTAEPARFSG